MLKNILNLEGALKLSSDEQKDIKGGKPAPLPVCGGEGFISTVNYCLCGTGGVYNYATQTCTNNNPTGRVWENATGCCYDFSL